MRARPIDTTDIATGSAAIYRVGVYRRQTAIMDGEIQPGFDVWAWEIEGATDVEEVLSWARAACLEQGGSDYSVSIAPANANLLGTLIAGTDPLHAGAASSVITSRRS